MPNSAQIRAQLRLTATTNLSPSGALDIVRQAAGTVKGGGMSLLTTGWVNVGAQVNIERESPDRLALSITSGKRVFELCTFSARTSVSTDGKTELLVGGLERYKTTQPTFAGFIPTGPKSIWGFDPYKRFLEATASALRERDPESQISIETPSAG